MQPHAAPEEDAVPVDGINHPSRGGLPAGPDTEMRAKDAALRAGSTALQIKEVPVMPVAKSQSLAFREVVERSNCFSRRPHLRNARDSPMPGDPLGSSHWR